MLSSTAARVAGARLFAARCAICHGPGGEGNGQRQRFMVPAPASLAVPPWTRREEAGRTFLAIRRGVPGTAMAAWPGLSDRETWELVAFIESLGRDR